jgi:hypothetical protein
MILIILLKLSAGGERDEAKYVACMGEKRMSY